jgi:hypothetical protein
MFGPFFDTPITTRLKNMALVLQAYGGSAACIQVGIGVVQYCVLG